MWKIGKQFDFCYGHRVWSQNLNSEFALDSCLKCRNLHGHQGTILIFLESNSLKEGMVTDFKHLNWFKKWLDDTLDHKFIMDINDPLKSTIFPLAIKEGALIEMDYGVKIINPELYSNYSKEVIEMYEGIVFVEFVPTSENLSKWMYDIVVEKMQPLGVTVSGIQFFETPKSQSNYIGI